MVYSTYRQLQTAKLVHTQVPDAAFHDGPDQSAHHNPNTAQKNGKTWYTLTNMVNHVLQLKNL